MKFSDSMRELPVGKSFYAPSFIRMVPGDLEYRILSREGPVVRAQMLLAGISVGFVEGNADRRQWRFSDGK